MRALPLFLFACASTPDVPVVDVHDGAVIDVVIEEPGLTPAAARAGYDEARANLETTRVALNKRWTEHPQTRAEVLVEARQQLTSTLTDALMPAWHGTDWDFYGTSVTPGKGKIACGYYVSTLLEHAGVKVNRVVLAQQASENIVKTFTPRDSIRRFRNKPASDVVAEVQAQGEGLYVLGLDYHAALLWNDGATVQMCHSSYLGTTKALCEPAAQSAAMVSDYRVIGKLMDDAMVQRWVEGKTFAVVR